MKYEILLFAHNKAELVELVRYSQDIVEGILLKDAK